MIYDGRDIEQQLGYYGGIYFRKHGPFKAGGRVEGHRHYVDHVTFLSSDRVRVLYRKALSDAPFKEVEIVAPFFFEVAADTYHEIQALEDGTAWACIFAVPPEEAEGEPLPFNQQVPEHG